MASGPFIFDMVEGDLLPFMQIEWEDADITGFTINLHFRQPTGLRVTKVAIIDDANLGAPEGGSAFFHFEWAVGDLLVGDSPAEIEVFDQLANNETFQGLIIRVTEEIS